MELRQLRYFVAVANALHFGRAAAELHIVQPALSQQVKRLERELGVLLLTRTKRRVQLTEPGRLFLQQARLTVAQSELGVRTTKRAAVGSVGRLAVGFSEIAMWTAFPRVLRAYRDRYPEVEITFNERPIPRLLDGLAHGELEICCIPLPLPGNGFGWKIIADAPLIAALPGGHLLTGRRRVPLTALAREPFVTFPLSLKTRLIDDLILAMSSNAGFGPRIVQEAEPLHTIIALVSAGMGVALAPGWVVNFRHAGVVYRQLTPAGPRFKLAVVWRTPAPSPTVTKFIALLETMGPRTRPG
jgi:DNA-binding transcriptional LysR family regulator